MTRFPARYLSTRNALLGVRRDSAETTRGIRVDYSAKAGVSEVEKITRSAETCLGHADEIAFAALLGLFAGLYPPLTRVVRSLSDLVLGCTVHADPVLELVLERHKDVRRSVERFLVAGADDHGGDAESQHHGSE